MTEFGVDEDGRFVKKSIDQIRDDLRENFRNELGRDFEFRQTSPITQLLDAVSIELARQWDGAEAVYYASFFEDAFGEQLDKQLALAGFSRRRLRGATGAVTFARDSPAPSDVTVPEETVVTTERTDTDPPIPFKTTEAATIFAGDQEVTDVPITALAPWEADVDEQYLGSETNVAAGTITRFESPVSGVDSVENDHRTGDSDAGFTEGRDEETDTEFKLRYQNTLAEGGTSTVSAMESLIFEYDDGIKGVVVEEIRDATDGYGPHPTVFAPDVDADTIAQAIFESRGAGLESFGDETGTATADDGRTLTERFDRADEATIEIEISVETAPEYPDNGRRRIENNLIRFIGGEAHDGILYPGLAIGETVIYDQVKKRVLTVGGVVEADVEMGIAGETLGTSNISIGDLEVAMTGIDEIEVSD